MGASVFCKKESYYCTAMGVLTKDVESDVKIGWWSDAIVCRALVDSRLVSINLLQSQGKTFHRSVFTGDGASLGMRIENGMIPAQLIYFYLRGFQQKCLLLRLIFIDFVNANIKINHEFFYLE